MTEAPPRSNLSPESSKWVEWANRNILNLLSRSTETIQTAMRAANAVNSAQDTSVVQQTHLETINEGLLDTQAQVDSVEAIAIDAYEQTTIETASPRQIDGMGGWILADGTEVSFDDFELLPEEEKEDAEYIPARPVNSVWDVKMDGSQLQDERWIWDGDTWTQYLIGTDVLDPDIIGNAYNYIANLAGSIVQVSPTEPVDPVSGTLWWQTDSSGVRFKGLWHYDGAAWQSYTLAANDIVAANSITAPLLSAGALDAFQITSPLIQSVATADRGIKWTGDVITGYTNTGEVGFQFDAGQATIKSGLIQGSIIDGGLVKGSQFELKTDNISEESTVYSQDFSTSLDGWGVAKVGGLSAKGTYTASRVASGGRTGGALRVVVTGEYGDPDGNWPVTRGQIERATKIIWPVAGTKTVSMWVKPTANAHVTMAAYAETPSGVARGFTDTRGGVNMIPANTWTKLEVEIPEGFGYGTTSEYSGRLFLFLYGGVGPDITYLVDDIMVAASFYGSQQVLIRQSMLGYPEIVANGSAGESVVVSTRTPDGYAGLSIYPADPQTTPPITISQEGIGRTIFQQGTQLLSWEKLFNPLVLGKFESFGIGDGTSTTEPGITLYRQDPSTGGTMSTGIYLADITGGVPSINIRKDGAVAGVFRIWESGRISMQTQSASSTANATRDLPFAIETGSVYVEALAANTAATFPITFATNRFTKPPVVVASIRGTTSALRHTVAVQSPTTTTGCTLRAANYNTGAGGNHYIEWIAIQATV